jgi:hypothetical protein
MSSHFDKLPQKLHTIPLDKACEMTKRYRDNKDHVLRPEYAYKGITPICETFNKKALLEIAAQPDCVGIRIYYGMDAAMCTYAILVGTDINGADILPPYAPGAKTTLADTNNGSGLAQDAIRCPTVCPPPSSLNGF